MLSGLSSVLEKCSDLSDRACRFFLAICFASMVSICLLQVFCRYVLDAALSWPEELTSYLMAWMTFVGAAVAVKSSEHISIDVLLIFLPRKLQSFLLLVMKILTLFVALYLFSAALSLTRSSTDMISDALGISIVWPRLSMPLGAALMALHLMSMIVADVKKLRGVEP